MAENITVLLTCVGGRFSLNTIHALRQTSGVNLRLVGVDMDSDTVARFFVDAFYPVPRGSDETYVSKISEICKKENVQILIPGADEEVVAISKSKTNLEVIGVKCAVDDFTNIELLSDKWALYRKLSENGLFSPNYSLVESLDQVENIAKDMGYPQKRFVLKPRTSRGSRGVWIIGREPGDNTLNDFISSFQDDGISRLEYIAIEHLPGPAYDVDVVADSGKIICVLPRKRIYKNVLSNFSEGHKAEHNTKIIETATSISRVLKLNYGFDFDYGSFADGTPAIYEINPRISGSVAAGMGSGLNIPAILVSMIGNMDLPKINIKFGVQMFPISDMLFMENDNIFREDFSPMRS